jgi:adenine phosphoribosyltransferase
VSVEYKKEYGIDKLEIHAESISFGDNVVIIDDVLATGGTMKVSTTLNNSFFPYRVIDKQIFFLL